MPSKTRGQIEEGLVTFTHDSEVDVTFAAASVQTKDFTSPPVVKLTSVSKYHPTLLSNQKNLLYDAAGNFVPTYPATTDDSGAQVGATTNTSVAPGYVGTINNSENIVAKARRLDATQHVTIPFDNSEIRDNSVIQIFFQLRFRNWDVDAGDGLGIYFVNESTIKAATDASPIDDAQTTGVSATLYMNKLGGWREVLPHVAQESGSIQVNSTQIDDVIGNFSTGGLYHWFMITVTKATTDTASDTEDIKTFAGISVVNNADSGEYVDLADVYVFVSDGVSQLGVEGSGGTNYLAAPVSEITQANIGVSFVNVTMQGMKVVWRQMTRDPFTLIY